MTKRHKHTKHLPKNNIAEAFGWVGSLMLLGGYALLSLGIIDSDSIIYHSTLLIGGVGLAIVTFRHKAFQSFTVNVFFALLASIAILRIIFFA